MTKPPSCTYQAERGWCSPEHLRACTDADCRGCRPCGEDHCELNGRCAEHVDHDAGIYTCPRCIGKVKREVRQIVERYAELPEEIEAKGVDSEALNLHGPAASAEQYGEKRARLRAGYERRGWCDWPRHEGFRENDPHHPYAVLGGWDLAMRESYGPQTDLFITVSSAADYLTGPLLEKFAHTQEFVDFAREVGQCLRHLETVLSDSRKGDRANVDCFDCGGQLMRKLTREGFDDYWTCSDCIRRYTHAEYHFALRAKIEEAVLENGS